MKRFILLTLLTIFVFSFVYIMLDKDAQDAIAAVVGGNRRQSTTAEFWMKVGDASAEIDEGAIVTMDTTGISGATAIHAGYVRDATSGTQAIVGVALTSAPEPTSNGQYEVLVDTSPSSVHYIIADATADVVQAIVGNSVDIANATRADCNASTNDLLQVVGIDPVEGTADTQAGIFFKINPEELQF